MVIVVRVGITKVRVGIRKGISSGKGSKYVTGLPAAAHLDASSAICSDR